MVLLLWKLKLLLYRSCECWVPNIYGFTLLYFFLKARCPHFKPNFIFQSTISSRTFGFFHFRCRGIYFNSHYFCTLTPFLGASLKLYNFIRLQATLPVFYRSLRTKCLSYKISDPVLALYQNVCSSQSFSSAVNRLQITSFSFHWFITKLETVVISVRICLLKAK